MSGGESSASFEGNVSFPQPQDARDFVVVLNKFLDSSSRIFFEIQKQPMYQLSALADAKALYAAAEGFELNAIFFDFVESQARCANAFEELGKHTQAYEATLLESRPHVHQWSLKQAESLAISIKGILGTLRNLIDFNENDVIVVVAQNITLCRSATDALEKATNFIPKHKSNLTNVTDGLREQIQNRATVIKDHSRREELLSMDRRLGPAIEIVLTRGTTDDFATLRRLLKEAQALFVPQFSEGDFSYKDVDAKAYNSAIDDLLSSIQQGKGPAIRDNAARLGNQAKALNDAGAALREQTKQLVAAAAEALKDKDSQDAQNRLQSIMANAKKEADRLAKEQAAANARRQQLLKASAGLGMAIGKLEENVDSYRQMTNKPTRTMDSALERDMDRQEEERLRKLGK